MLERVDSQLQKELFDVINHDVADPRVDAIVTVTYVDAVKDLSYAKVGVSASGTNDAKQLLKALNAASGHIRHVLFKRMRIRTVPHLEFVFDNSMDNSYRVSELLRKIEEDVEDNGAK